MAEQPQSPRQAPPGMPKPANAPVTPPKKTGFFGGKAKGPADLGKSVAELAGELNNVSRRLMILEERYMNLRKKSQVTDQNMLANHKKIMTEVETTNSDLDDLKKQTTDIVGKLKIMVRELKDCAKHNEVQVLQKYINLWEPVNFVTRNSVFKMVKDQVEAEFKDLNIKLKQEDYIKEQIRIALRGVQSQHKENP